MPEKYLLDTDRRLARAIQLTMPASDPQWFIPRADFENALRELDELRRALALLNVAVTIKDVRVSLDVRKILDPLGETVEQAKATGSIILGARTRALKV